MLTIFCGEDVAVSRTQYARHIETVKEGGYEIVSIAPGDLEKLAHEISFSTTLFSSKRLYTIENVLSKKQGRETIAKLNTIDVEIVIWEESTDERTIKKAFPKAKILATKLSATLWKFLDNLQPGNLQLTIKTMRDIQGTNDIHLIHFMLLRRLKELLIVINGGSPAKLATWQISKLTSQARAWKPEHLESCFKKLVEIEMQFKSGTMVYELDKALEITLSFYL